MVDAMEQLRTEITDLTFENQTLRKDLADSVKLLKDYQEQDVTNQHRDKLKSE
jgi:hypothetical protein